MDDMDDAVQCRKCGELVPKQQALGVGFSGRMLWTCTGCLNEQSINEVFSQMFAQIGEKIQKIVTKDARQGEGG